jgi:hypothetical protein
VDLGEPGHAGPARPAAGLGEQDLEQASVAVVVLEEQDGEAFISVIPVGIRTIWNQKSSISRTTCRNSSSRPAW